MRHLMLLLLMLSSLFVFGQKPKVSETKVKLLDAQDETIIRYDIDSAIIHFNKKDLVKYCEETLKSYSHLNYQKALLSLLKNSSDTSIYIKDSIVGNPKTGFTDWTSLQSQYSEALTWATVELLKIGRAKVYNTRKKMFVEYIIVKETETPYKGYVDFYFEDDDKFYTATYWIA